MAKTGEKPANPLVALIGNKDGDKMLFEDWVAAARSNKLQAAGIQTLKRRGEVHTYLDPNGDVYIVIGRRPQAK